jgi:hypothetical protein
VALVIHLKFGLNPLGGDPSSGSLELTRGSGSVRHDFEHELSVIP